MDISSIASTDHSSFTSGESVRQPHSKAAASSYSMDKVSLSKEAVEKYFAMKNGNKPEERSDISTQVATWYDDFRKNMGMVNEPDYSTWPKENQERRQKLIEEGEALFPQCSQTSFTEANKKMNDIVHKIMALDAVGAKQVISDNNMDTALKSLHDSMDRWEGGANKFALAAGLIGGKGQVDEEEEAILLKKRQWQQEHLMQMI